MINIKTEKESVLELIKENRPIVEINLKMAKKHIKKKGIKKASKNKKANNKDGATLFEIFMEEAYKQLRLDGLALAKEKIELSNELVINNDNNKSNKNKDSIKSNVEVLTNNSKLNKKNTKSIDNDNYKKIDSTKKNESNLFNENEVSKDNSCINKDTSLKSISCTNEKSKKSIIPKFKALDCPPSINNSINVELVSPFTEVKIKEGCSQLGFSVLTDNTPIEKTKRKRCKKRNLDDNTYKESVSQLSLFSLI